MKTIIFHICIGMRKRKKKTRMRLSQFLYRSSGAEGSCFPAAGGAWVWGCLWVVWGGIVR